MGVGTSRAAGERVRRLTKHEIDRRIEQLVGEIASACADGGPDGDRCRPRWLAPRDLVRHVLPLLVQN